MWFAPLPTGPLLNPSGSTDYMALFRRGAQWKRAARHVRVFKLYGGWILYAGATQAQLRLIIADLKRRHIALAVEAPALPATSTCGNGVEGFHDSAGSAAILASKIKRAGGTLKYVAFDEPFAFGSLYDGANSCQWTAQRVAGDLHHYVRSLRRWFPHVVAGDIEPLWAGHDPQALADWMGAYKRATGSRLGFFHLDLDYDNLPKWPQEAHSLERAAHTHGIPFGIIYYGGYAASTDLEWTSSAEQRFVEYEAQAGFRPDQAVLQSWEDKPDQALPETQQGTFTWLIDQYLRPRTHLKLSLSGDSASARLTDPHGSPLNGKTVMLSATPLDGNGAYAEYDVSGTVPADAVQAVVGLRVNMECGCAGPADLTLYQSSYTQAGGANLVPNPNFAQGITGWGTWGNANVAVDQSDRGGLALNVTASPSQQAGLNSSEFAVSAGQSFHLAFDARVSPLSTGSGYFALIFLHTNGSEVTRTEVPLTAASITLGSAITNQNGVATGSVKALHGATFRVQELFPGDASWFPAYATTEVARP